MSLPPELEAAAQTRPDESVVRLGGKKQSSSEDSLVHPSPAPPLGTHPGGWWKGPVAMKQGCSWARRGVWGGLTKVRVSAALRWLETQEATG